MVFANWGRLSGLETNLTIVTFIAWEYGRLVQMSRSLSHKVGPRYVDNVLAFKTCLMVTIGEN